MFTIQLLRVYKVEYYMKIIKITIDNKRSKQVVDN